jgi:hypothetical protein
MHVLQSGETRMKPNERQYMMRRLLWKEGVQAVKLSVEFSDFESFRKELINSLHYNSSYVRARNTNSIIRWFFSSRSIDNLLTKVWAFYKDETILKEIMRYEYLTREPAVAEFIVNYLLPLLPGGSIRMEYFKDFLLKKYGVVKKDPLNSLRGACRDLGFVYCENKKLVICQIPTPKTSLLILTHYLFTQTPRTVTLKEILSNPFWQYLGIRESEVVKRVFREADSAGIIAKYILADQLEQVTTRYSFDEFVQRRIQL